MNPRSIQFRLTAWYAGLLTAVSVALGLLLVYQLRGSMEANLLDSQVRRARQIADTLIPKLPQLGAASLAGQIQSFYAPESSGRFIRITRPDGRPVYCSGPPQDQSFDPTNLATTALSNAPGTRTLTLPEGQRFVLAAARGTTTTGSAYLVEAGAPTAPIQAMITHLVLLMLVGVPVMILVAAGGGWVLVKRALAPVAELAGTAERITHHSLNERLPITPSGDELERLSVSLNRMITRLDDAFANSKRFVADASHELRTPLTVLRGELEGLLREPGFNADQRDRLGSLLEEIQRLSHIVERLLTLSRLDAGEAQVEWVTFDLGELVSSVADQLNLLAKDKGITLTCAAASRVHVRGDRTRFKQVVVNLLDNALKYTPEQGRITLTVSARPNEAWLEVADDGVGIPASALPHVFDRFYRVDPARAPADGGAGLGLAIVKSICSAHGGHIQVQSQPGGGSRFLVRLPLASPESA